MSFKYIYQKVANLSLLSQEIKDSNIIISLDYVNSKDNLLEIYFKAELSQNDIDLLSSIVDTHDPSKNIFTVEPVDLDNKNIMHQTSKPVGSLTMFTSSGDDIYNKLNVGDGELMIIEHNLSDPMIQTKYIDFNIKENKTWLHEGYINWKNADFDLISMSLVPRLTEYTEGFNTNYELLENGLIIPANGDGNINIDLNNIQLVEATIQESTRKRYTAFWDASYNYETHEFYNIVPNFNGTGVYNIFGNEIIISKFVNKIMFVDSGFMMLQTSDAAEIGEGTRFKFEINTMGEDHYWKASLILTLHRVRTS